MVDGASTEHFTPSTPVRREPWPGNAEGEAVFTRPTMARFILEDGDLPEIKEKASLALEQAGFPRTDRGKAEAIVAFARRVMKYVPDPPLRQTCVRPRYMLCARGVADLCIRVGNCVNMNCALGALLRSVGFDVRVQGIEYGGGAQDHVNILVLLRDERNKWCEIDATTDQPVGYVSPGKKLIYDPHNPKVTGAGADKGVFIGAGRPFATEASGWDDAPMSYAQAVTGQPFTPQAPERKESGYSSLFVGAGAMRQGSGPSWMPRTIEQGWSLVAQMRATPKTIAPTVACRSFQVFFNADPARGSSPTLEQDGEYGPCTQAALWMVLKGQTQTSGGVNIDLTAPPEQGFPGRCVNGKYAPLPVEETVAPLRAVGAGSYAALFIGAGAGVQTQQFGGITVVHVTDLGNGDAVQVPAQPPGTYLHVTVRGNETGLGSSQPTYKSHPGVNPDLSVSPTAISSVDASRTGGQEFWFILNGDAGQIELDWQDVVLYQNNQPEYAPAIARVNVAGNAAPAPSKVVLVPIPASGVHSATKVKVVLVAIPSKTRKSSSTVGVTIPYDPTKNISAPMSGATAGAGASIYTFLPGTCTRSTSTLAAGGGKLPADALGNSVSDMQAQFDSISPGLYQVLSVDYNSDGSRVDVTIKYLGTQPYNVSSPTKSDVDGISLTTSYQTVDCTQPWSTGKKVAVGAGVAAGALALAGLIYWAAP